MDNIKGEKEVQYLDLIDKEASSHLDKVQLGQQEVIFQIIQTEQKYLQELKDIFTVSLIKNINLIYFLIKVIIIM